MKNKILFETVKKLLKEENQVEDAVESASASFDKQVRRILNEAIKKSVSPDKNESKVKRGRYLFEAEEEETKKEDPSLNSSKKSLNDLDIGVYTEAVVNLLDNFDSLIEIKDTLLTMAKVTLKNSYDESTTKAFVDLLNVEYNIQVGESQYDKDIENQPPPAAGAGPE